MHKRVTTHLTIPKPSRQRRYKEHAAKGERSYHTYFSDDDVDQLIVEGERLLDPKVDAAVLAEIKTFSRSDFISPQEHKAFVARVIESVMKNLKNLNWQK